MYLSSIKSSGSFSFPTYALVCEGLHMGSHGLFPLPWSMNMTIPLLCRGKDCKGSFIYVCRGSQRHTYRECQWELRFKRNSQRAHTLGPLKPLTRLKICTKSFTTIMPPKNSHGPTSKNSCGRQAILSRHRLLQNHASLRMRTLCQYQKQYRARRI